MDNPSTVCFMIPFIKVFYQTYLSSCIRKPTILGFRPCLTQTDLYSHRSRLEALNCGFMKKRDCTIRVAKTKMLISCTVTAQLLCIFVFAYAYCWFSHEAAHFILSQHAQEIKTYKNFNQKPLTFAQCRRQGDCKSSSCTFVQAS